MYTNMDQWAEIRRRVLVEGASKRSIQREYKIHWKTLQKILREAEPPGYRQSQPRPKKKLGPFRDVLSPGESVRPYVRRVTQVFGRKVKPGVFAFIPGFTRRQHIPERPYARPALRESIAEINEIFRAGLAAEMSRL